MLEENTRRYEKHFEVIKLLVNYGTQLEEFNKTQQNDSLLSTVLELADSRVFILLLGCGLATSNRSLLTQTMPNIKALKHPTLMLQHMVLAGQTTSNICQYFSIEGNSYEWNVISKKRRELTLQDRCRIIIRQLLIETSQGYPILPLVRQLPLSKSLEIFLTFGAIQYHEQPVFKKDSVNPVIMEQPRSYETFPCLKRPSNIYRNNCLKLHSESYELEFPKYSSITSRAHTV